MLKDADDGSLLIISGVIGTLVSGVSAAYGGGDPYTNAMVGFGLGTITLISTFAILGMSRLAAQSRAAREVN